VDGGVVENGVDAGLTGVAALQSPVRYVTLPAGGDTAVARIGRDGGRVQRSRRLRGTFTIPAIALDGTASGLSADGRTLVLIRPRPAFPRTRTQLAVLDARRLRVRELIVLGGDFSYDALSPDGAMLFLVRDTSHRDPPAERCARWTSAAAACCANRSSTRASRTSERAATRSRAVRRRRRPLAWRSAPARSRVRGAGNSEH
jgi:hypothetical protein